MPYFCLLKKFRMRRIILILGIILSLSNISKALNKNFYVVKSHGLEETLSFEDMKNWALREFSNDIEELNSNLPTWTYNKTTLKKISISGTTIHFDYEVHEEILKFKNTFLVFLKDNIRKEIKDYITGVIDDNSGIMPFSEWERLFMQMGLKFNITIKDIQNSTLENYSLTIEDLSLVDPSNTSTSHIYKFDDGDEIIEFTAEEYQEEFFVMIRQRMKEINEQLPIKIDEVTTLYSAIINGSDINYNYRVSFEKELFTDEEIEELRKEVTQREKENLLYLMKQNSDKMPVEEWIKLFNEIDMQYHFNYQDINGRIITKIIVDFKDM